ncbi:hypothetical protein GLUCOINTEAF2_0203847 [Komagataeibacter intermedius AF2]|uniref:Uncharacterized protein n=1 Tax=Komagataeibacter intermedius AF2 TaxID=1458464 RepID=A0A0N1N6Y3_9PROT|nr:MULTISPECIES: hypothetical protein [Komagataeibacter]KPH88358.1 hypothetical protein GLUCOINTEAF2_0203847 [Komagataeibacter intermedius AF2]
MQLTCYHVCKNEGSPEFIKKNAPFISKGANRWLGEGAYLWTDSDMWARFWNKTAYDSLGIIIKFMVDIPDEEVLDLVGNVKQQIEFYEAWYDVSKKLKRNIKNISAYIMFLRELNEDDGESFTYAAIRAKDNPRIDLNKEFSVKKINFIPKKLHEDNDSVPYSTFMERHQICVFPEFKARYVRFEKFTYPSTFGYTVTREGVR